jgi:hypothetical protein
MPLKPLKYPVCVFSRGDMPRLAIGFKQLHWDSAVTVKDGILLRSQIGHF